MAKYCNPDVLDAALNVVKTTATRQVICSTFPTTYTQAITTYMLAEVTISTTDFTLAAGTVSGRKFTLASKSGTNVTNSGTGIYVALVDVTGTKLLFVTTMTSQVLTAGNPITFGAWSDEIQDPA